MSHTIAEIDPLALAHEAEHNPAVMVIDVRADWEVQQAALPGAVHIPLTAMMAGPSACALLPENKDTPIVTYCHHGVRSMRAAEALEAMGYTHLRSLRGGIDAYAMAVDPSLGRY